MSKNHRPNSPTLTASTGNEHSTQQLSATFFRRKAVTEDVTLSPRIQQQIEMSPIRNLEMVYRILAFSQRGGSMVLHDEWWAKLYDMLPQGLENGTAPPPLIGAQREASNNDKYDRLVEHILWADQYDALLENLCQCRCVAARAAQYVD